MRESKPAWDLFGLGLVEAVTAAVLSRGGPGSAPPFAARPRNAPAWFINSYPLLGALAAAFKIDRRLHICYRMEISIAAVDRREPGDLPQPRRRAGRCAHALRHGP